MHPFTFSILILHCPWRRQLTINRPAVQRATINLLLRGVHRSIKHFAVHTCRVFISVDRHTHTVSVTRQKMTVLSHAERTLSSNLIASSTRYLRYTQCLPVLTSSLSRGAPSLMSISSLCISFASYVCIPSEHYHHSSLYNRLFEDHTLAALCYALSARSTQPCRSPISSISIFLALSLCVDYSADIIEILTLVSAQRSQCTDISLSSYGFGVVMKPYVFLAFIYLYYILSRVCVRRARLYSYSI